MYIFNGCRLHRNVALSLFCYGVFAYERSRLAYANKHCFATLRAVNFHRRACFAFAKPSSANGTSYIFHNCFFLFPLLTNVLYLSNCLARSGRPSLQLNLVCKRVLPSTISLFAQRQPTTIYMYTLSGTCIYLI